MSQKARHEVMQDIGYLKKTEAAFVERFEKPSQRIMFLLTRQKCTGLEFRGGEAEV